MAQKDTTPVGGKGGGFPAALALRALRSWTVLHRFLFYT